MATDQLPCWIYFGGRLRRSDLTRLLEIIQGERVALHWENPPLATLEDFEAGVRHDRPYLLVSRGSDCGCLPRLEKFCRDTGLAYRRYSVGPYRDSEVAGWEPGLGRDRRIQTTLSGDVTTSLPELILSLRNGKSLRQVVEELRWFQSPFDFLPPFEIIDD